MTWPLDSSGACLAADNGNAGYHKVTVMVTNVNEPGMVTLEDRHRQWDAAGTWWAQP